ncbi:unnamed protein product [Oncorhynchus mykiss]|uniref:PLD-like domain-containing protein n=1 Tax=Oncorhynchus mykiss TaxID=8022 RepID=A0A060Y0G7_ONCMY|nr:unnamed protein product [Oncorhynchus mykiss]
MACYPPASFPCSGAEVREVDLQSVARGIIHTKLWVVDQRNTSTWAVPTWIPHTGEGRGSFHGGLQLPVPAVLHGNSHDIRGVLEHWCSDKWFLYPPLAPPCPILCPLPAQVHLSSAPPQISVYGRSDDLSTILTVIADAHKYVSISVMDYIPLSQFTEPLRFWPAIDSSIRAAACSRGVEVNLLVSCWSHSVPLSTVPDCPQQTSPGLQHQFGTFAVSISPHFLNHKNTCRPLKRAHNFLPGNVPYYFHDELFDLPSTAEQKKIIFSSEPCQVHGDRPSCLYTSQSLLIGQNVQLFHPHCRCWAGGEPDWFCGGRARARGVNRIWAGGEPDWFCFIWDIFPY